MEIYIAVIIAAIVWMPFILALIFGGNKSTPSNSEEPKEHAIRRTTESTMPQDSSMMGLSIDRKIEKALSEKNFEIAEALIRDYYNEYSDEGYAVSMHFFLLKNINLIYSYRYEDDMILFLVLGLCDLDMALIGPLKRKMEFPLNLVSPTRKAIILDKMGRIEEAVAVCDWAIKNNVLDDGATFDKRKNRLLKKMKTS